VKEWEVGHLTSPNGNTRWTSTCVRSISKSASLCLSHCITDTEKPSFLPFLLFLRYGVVPSREGTRTPGGYKTERLPSLLLFLFLLSLISPHLSRSPFIFF